MNESLGMRDVTRRHGADLPPDRLYKYRSMAVPNRAFLEALFRECAIYFASPADFNDPLDSRVHLTFPSESEPFREYVERLLAKYFPNLTPDECRERAIEIVRTKQPHCNAPLQQALIDSAQQEVNRNGVFCLCERPDNVLMWSHYADCHRGLCLEFEITTDFVGIPLDVGYPETRPAVDFFRDPPFRQVEVNLLMKASGWAYEREWRIIDTDRGFGVRHFLPDHLSGIIFGCRMPQADRDTVRTWIECGPCRPTFYEACLVPGSYGVQITPIHP